MMEVKMGYLNINYNDYADKYSKYRNSSPRIIKHILEELSDRSIHRILEIGCGTADHLFDLARNYKTESAYGFDKSGKMVREGNLKNPGLNLTVADALAKFPYKSDFFDFAYSVNVIHYITNLTHYFAEAYRVLKNNGVVLTVTTSTDEMKKYLLKYFPEFGQDETKSSILLNNIRCAMEGNGFKNINVSYTNFSYKMSVSDLAYIENKTAAWSRLLSQKCFEKGIVLMREDAKKGICDGSENFVYLWGSK